MPVILALDQGTTSSRAIVFDERCRAIGTAQRELPQIFPRSGWVEQDPEVIWATQLATAREALANAGLHAADVAAIGITNQRETTIVWERSSGRPIGNAIVWQDRRTADHCQRLEAEGHGELFRQRTGLVLDAYFSGTKVAWLLDHVPGARERAQAGELAFGTVDSWLIWKLTGGAVHATDVTNASRTLLFDIGRGEWDDRLLELVGVPRAVLPAVVASSGIVATSRAELLGSPIPIAGIAGDQQAALFGQRCTTPGRVKNTYGTGCFLLMHTGTSVPTSRHRLIGTVAWRSGGRTDYALEGSVFIAGAAIQWLRDGLGLIARAEDVEALAAGVPDSGGVCFVPAFTGLGAPHWDPQARGAVFGITRGTTRAHLARAALEAIAFQTADIVGCMQADAGIALTELRADGGASRNDLLLQFQADLLGVPVVRAAQTESTALGAAMLAGLGVGMWPDGAALDDLWQAGRVFEPSMAPSTVAALKSVWTEAVSRSLRWHQDA